MKIISHASNVQTEKGIQEYSKIIRALQSPADAIELDLNLTKDGKFVCIHNPFHQHQKISETDYETLKLCDPSILTVEEALEIIGSKKQVLLDIKNYNVNQDLLAKTIILILSNVSTDTMIESTDLELLNFIREKINLETLAVANYFTNISYFTKFTSTPKCDGIALASELFGFFKKYEKILKYSTNNPKLYAWTWTAIHQETEKLFKRFIESDCDGIICNEVYKLERILKNEKNTTANY